MEIIGNTEPPVTFAEIKPSQIPNTMQPLHQVMVTLHLPRCEKMVYAFFKEGSGEQPICLKGKARSLEVSQCTKKRMTSPSQSLHPRRRGNRTLQPLSPE